MIAVDALVDPRHFFLPCRGQVPLRRGAPQQKRHTSTVGNINLGGARQAVAAAPAKVSSQFALVVVDDSLERIGQLGWVVNIGQEFVQLALPLDTPDGEYVVVLSLEGICGGGVDDQPAGQGLHGDKAHVLGSARLHQRDFFSGG